MEDLSCSAVKEDTNICKQSNATCGACLTNHSTSPPQTDLDAKEIDLLAWVLKSPKGINKSHDQPLTSYIAKGEKEKKTQKMII